MRTPIIIQSLWIGAELSKLEQLCIASFLRHGHEFHLYTYGVVKGVPKGTTLMDANTVIDESRIFTYTSGWGKGSYAGFADLFRYHLLYQKGGWWVDTDIICLKPFLIDQDLVIATAYEGSEGVFANNCILRSLPGHPLMKYLVEEVEGMDMKKVEFAQTGPLLLQKAIKELGLEGYQVPYYYFNPVSWRNVRTSIVGEDTLYDVVKKLARPILRPGSGNKGLYIHPGSFAVHLWNEVWRQNGLGKNDPYPRRSLYERLKKKYNVA